MMKYNLLTFILLLIISCEGNMKVHLTAPADRTTGQNVVTARLVWSNGCDSFDVYLGTDPEEIKKIATVKEPVYNTVRLDFNTTYFWMVNGYRNDRDSIRSQVWNFTTRDHSKVSGLSSEYGSIVDGVGYFQDPNGTDVKAVDLDTFEELWTYRFEDLYDVSPMIEKKRDGTWLLIEHERTNSRVRALYLATGEEAWISDNNIPYIGGTGFNYYVNKNGLTILLAKGSNGLHALSIEDGSELWFTPAQSWFSTVPAVDQKNRLIYSKSFERVEKIDAETGKVLRSAYTVPDAMTNHSNTLLANDDYGYFVATANWNGNLLYGDITVYDSSLNVVWGKQRLIERLSSLCYHEGVLYSAQSGGWYEFQNKLTDKTDWKHITAFDIRNGNVKWDVSLAGYKYTNIHDVVYCNGYVYALTDNTGTAVKENRILFRIRSEDGFLEEALDFGHPRSICASPVITGGKIFEAGVPTELGKGEKTEWYGQYGVRQLNHNSADDKAVITTLKMRNLQFDISGLNP